MATTYLIDSNILVYSYDIDSPYYEKSMELMETRVLKGEINACIAHQSLYEFYAVITDPKRVRAPLEQNKAMEIIELFQNAVNLKKIFSLSTTLNTTMKLLKKYPVLKQNIFDLILVATMLDNGIKGVYTANEIHFKPFDFLEVINPLKGIS